MNALSLFTLDLLEELSLRHDDQERWEFTLDRLNEIGFNALNMLCFTPETGAIHWVRSSMSKGWLNRYDSQGYAEADPMLAQVQNGKESLLGDFHVAYHFHAFFTAFLFFEQFPFAGDISAITFGEYILSQRLYVGARDDTARGICLDGHYEHLPWDQVFEF